MDLSALFLVGYLKKNINKIGYLGLRNHIIMIQVNSTLPYHELYFLFRALLQCILIVTGGVMSITQIRNISALHEDYLINAPAVSMF